MTNQSVMQQYYQSYFTNPRIWLFTHLAGIIMLILLFISQNFYKKILVYSGYTAVAFLILVLALNPLQRIYPSAQYIKTLNKYRRQIGVASFSYSVIHVIAVILKLLKKKNWAKIIALTYEPAIIPVIWFSLPILFLLTLTSNSYSIKRLGFQKWKALHQKVYVAELMIFLHIFLVGEWFYAVLLFIPLFLLQKSTKY